MPKRFLFEHLLLACVFLQHVTKAAEERITCVEEGTTENCLYLGTKNHTIAKTLCSSFNQSLVFYSGSILENGSDKFPETCFNRICFKLYGSKNHYKLKLHLKECNRKLNNHKVTLGNETFLCSPYCFICRQDKESSSDMKRTTVDTNTREARIVYPCVEQQDVIDLTEVKVFDCKEDIAENFCFILYSVFDQTTKSMDDNCTERDHLVLSGNLFIGVVNGSNASHWISVILANCSSVNESYWQFEEKKERFNTLVLNKPVMYDCKYSEVRKTTNTAFIDFSQTDSIISVPSVASTVLTTSPGSNTPSISTTDLNPITTTTTPLLFEMLSTAFSTPLTTTSKLSTTSISPTKFSTTFKSTPESSTTSKMSSTVLMSTPKLPSTLISPTGSSTLLTNTTEPSTSIKLFTIVTNTSKIPTSTMLYTILTNTTEIPTSTMLSTILASTQQSSTLTTLISPTGSSAILPKTTEPSTSRKLFTIVTNTTKIPTSTMLSTILASTLQSSTLTSKASDSTSKSYTTLSTSKEPSTRLVTSPKAHFTSTIVSMLTTSTLKVVTNSANTTTTSKDVNVTDTPTGKPTTTSTTTTSTTTTTTATTTAAITTTATTTKKPRTCPETEKRDLKWRETFPGKCRHIACPEGTTGNATWCCDSKTSEWVSDGPDLSDCKSIALKDIFDKIEENGIQDTLNELRDFVKNETRGQEGDILTITDFLNKATEFFEKESANLTQEEKKEKATNITNVVVDTCSEIIDKEMSWQKVPQIRRSEIVSNLFQAVDNGGFLLASTLNRTNTTVKKGNLVLEVAKIVREDYVNKTLRLPLNDQMSATFTHSASVLLPQGFVNTLEEGEGIPLVYTRYSGVNKVFGETCSESSCKLPRNISSQTRLNTPVVGTSLKNKGKNVTFSDGVNITLQHLNNPSKKPSCVFWSLDREGYWDVSGCDVVLQSDTHTTCRCTHLTNFAVIMDVHDIFGNIKLPKALEIVSIIGCSCSILSLIVCLIVFNVFRPLSGRTLVIHRNLCFCLLGGNILVIGALERTENRVWCYTIAGSLHFFYMAAFMWMFLEGVHMYLLVVKVFRMSRSYTGYFYAVGYGVPIIIVGVSLGTSYSNYASMKYCWLTSENGLIWSFAGPTAFIILINLVVLVLTLKSATRLEISRKETSKLIEIRAYGSVFFI